MRVLPHALSSLAALAAVALLPALPLAAQSGSFGTAVVIGEDELLIGEPTNTFRPGLVYVYRRAAGGEWRETATLRAPEAERADGFGTVLARTGNTLFVGQRAGPVHVFEKQGEVWRSAGVIAGTERIGIQPPADAPRGVPVGCNQYGYCDARFGVTLAAAGDWLLIGEPREPGEREGGGGHQGAVAGAMVEGAGVVHVFRRGANGEWTRQAELQPSAASHGDGFGSAVEMTAERALIGAPGLNDSAGERAGAVFEFVLSGGEWREEGRIAPALQANGAFGASLALDGDVVVIGEPGREDGRGAAYVYRRDASSGAWLEQGRLDTEGAAAGDRFGSAVGIAGGDVWVGAPAPRDIETGSVYVYAGAPAGEGVRRATRRIRLEETVERDGFGDRIVAGGGLAVVTATGMHHRAGSVHLYAREGASGWQDAGTLLSPPDALEAATGEERPCADGRVGPFDCEDVELLAFVPISMLRAGDHARGVRTNDNWGWTDPETGREYALVGRNDGTSFVDITDPVNPVLIGDLPKTPGTPPSQLWRDIKTYRDHAYIVADGAGGHGMQVFDLTRLRAVTEPPARFEPDVHYDRIASVHNIAINEETGFAYLVGSRDGGETCGGGLHMVDIREPKNPRFAGCFRDEQGTHDVQCLIYRGPDTRYEGRELCLKSNGSQFAISDVTDKENPRALSRASSPGAGYIHQGWVTEDHRYFFQDDEADVIQGSVPTTRTLVWDLSDVEDPVLVTEFMGSMPASAHNLYVRGHLAYQANYRYGLHVLDISDPENPREVGSFDTAPHLEGPGFSGAWSVYPFFESGTVIVTSLQEGLFLLKPRAQGRPIT